MRVGLHFVCMALAVLLFVPPRLRRHPLRVSPWLLPRYCWRLWFACSVTDSERSSRACLPAALPSPTHHNTPPSTMPHLDDYLAYGDVILRAVTVLLLPWLVADGAAPL